MADHREISQDTDPAQGDEFLESLTGRLGSSTNPELQKYLDLGEAARRRHEASIAQLSESAVAASREKILRAIRTENVVVPLQSRRAKRIWFSNGLASGAIAASLALFVFQGSIGTQPGTNSPANPPDSSTANSTGTNLSAKSGSVANLADAVLVSLVDSDPTNRVMEIGNILRGAEFQIHVSPSGNASITVSDTSRLSNTHWRALQGLGIDRGTEPARSLVIDIAAAP